MIWKDDQGHSQAPSLWRLTMTPCIVCPVMKIPFLFTLIAVLLAMPGCTTSTRVATGSAADVARESVTQIKFSLETHWNRQTRLAGLARPILAANTDLCGKDTIKAYGFNWLTQVDIPVQNRVVVERHFGITEQPFINIITPDSAAEKAGLRRGDILLAINGESVPAAIIRGSDSRKRIMAMLEDASSAGETVRIKYLRGEFMEREALIDPVTQCKYGIILVKDDSVNAFADGDNIYVTTGMYRFAETQAELQTVIAHELAHNSEGHVTKKLGNYLLGSIIDVAIAASTGIYTSGLFGNTTSMIFSQNFEREADYVGMYMLERADIDSSESANLWRRMAAENRTPGIFNFARTHPTTAERFTNLDATYQEIQEKRRSGQSLYPNRR